MKRDYRPTRPADLAPLFDREPPAAPEAERDLVAALINDPAEIPAVRALCPSGAAFSDQLGSVAYDALLSLYKDSPASVSKAAILDQIRTWRVWPTEDELQAHVAPYLDHWQAGAAAPYYAKIVAQKHELRTIIAACGDALHRVYHAPHEDADELVESVRADLARAQAGATASGFVDAAADLTAVLEDGATDEVITTGFLAWDDLFDGGLRPGEVHVVAARPGAGKTSLAIRVAEDAAESGAAVAVATLEMSRRQLARRRLSAESGVPLRAIRRNDYARGQYEEVVRAEGRMAGRTFRVLESQGYAVEGLASAVASEVASHGVRLLLVDYLQLLRTERDTNNREREVGIVAETLKTIAVKHNVSVLALAQCNRQIDHAERPQMNHLRESGVIEQVAESISFIHRTETGTELVVVKQRDGATGDIPLCWDAQHATFRDPCRMGAERPDPKPTPQAPEGVPV